MKANYRHLLVTVYQCHNAEIVAWLQRKFPCLSYMHAEDAVQEAFVEALERPPAFCSAWRAGGLEAVVRLLRQAAWRKLRGYWRKKATRCELPGGEQVTAYGNHAVTPQEIAIYQQILGHIWRLIDEAAERFGGRRSRALRAALHDRLAGSSDIESANTHGVPREYVNRAKRWIGAQLHG